MQLQIDRELVKKSLTLATASLPRFAKIVVFLTAHNVVTCPRMALPAGAFSLPPPNDPPPAAALPPSVQTPKI